MARAPPRRLKRRHRFKTERSPIHRWSPSDEFAATSAGLIRKRKSRRSVVTTMMAIVDMPTMMPIGPIVRLLRIFGVVALIDAEHAFHAADDAANRRADDGADRASDTVTLIEAMSGAFGNALSLYGYRHSKRCETRDAN